MVFKDPMVFTIANLTQYGGGAVIAPNAKADDGKLELVVALKKDIPILVTNIIKLFDGSIHERKEVFTRSFKKMRVIRKKAHPIQVDGELLDGDREITITVNTGALKVLTPISKKPNIS